MRMLLLDTPGAATLEAIRDIGFDMTLQWKLLLYSFILGIALAVLYDITRFLRVLMLPDGCAPGKKPGLIPSVLIFIEDTAFFVIAAIILTVFVFHTNHGDVRGFVLAGTLGGFLVYLFTVGRVTMWLSGKLVRAFYRLLSLIFTPVFRAAAGIFPYLYQKTLGRAFAALSRRRRRIYTDRIERELIRLLSHLPDQKGSMNEPGTTVNTCKTGNHLGIHLHDYHTGQRADPLQQSAGGAGEDQRAHRGRAGRHRRASE